MFLNDDIAVVDPAWMRELVGWATRPEIGCAGLQLTTADGAIQHGGVVVGAGGGFAGHLFAGLRPGEDTLLGSTRWYRDVTAVTGACVAIRRELHESLGGFDERMVLCGSDVALGIAAGIGGLRNICSAATPMQHLESATRGDSPIPEMDFHASYWRYQTLLHGGDPWHSPALSLEATDISFGSIASSDVEVAPPAGAKVVEVQTSIKSDFKMSPEQLRAARDLRNHCRRSSR